MRKFIVAGFASAALFAPLSAPVRGADEQTVVVPFPTTTTSRLGKVFYCDATVGAYLDALSKEKEVPISNWPKSGMRATAYKPTDRLVLVIEESGNLLTLYKREAFESGKANGDPFDIAYKSADVIIATVLVTALPSIAVVTLDRKTGIATWTTTKSHDFLTEGPRVDTEFFSCGPRKP